MRKIILSTFMLLSLFGCDDNTTLTSPEQPDHQLAKTIPEALEEMVKSKSMPDLDHSTDVAGTDENGNGVRDDIDRYISGLPYTSFQKAALIQYAAGMQSALIDFDQTF